MRLVPLGGAPFPLRAHRPFLPFHPSRPGAASHRAFSPDAARRACATIPLIPSTVWKPLT
ncbi:hypothetical protein PUN4_600143 [Paraburkholderia unamae]|nr:hypothetical protein PUN4_600143 [Paraburkholderia unamae]